MKVRNWEEARCKSHLEPSFSQTIPKVENLYIAGNILPSDLDGITVVGSRKMTSYGKSAVDFFVSVICKYFTIVSGLMYGVDLEAHESAINNDGRTIAVLGYGFNHLTNNSYANRVANKIINKTQGAVISEFEPEVPPSKWTFPQRNRIVAALGKAVLVVEAGERSGSLITADFGIELGKDVFVIPGSIFSDQSRGKHNLLKEGAILVDSPYDILDYYNIDYKTSKPSFKNDKLKKVFDLLTEEYSEVSMILEKSQMVAVEFIAILSELELDGYIEKDMLNRVRRK